ncbi:hypothetical protein [Bosea sp. BK604]|uniref:hypothetical protein n=1 Tax=Bosea sp. BK604 TaxID=2512180 RepID=UPI00104AC281|nr:hypothetical protein [Bosea sp. BK604]
MAATRRRNEVINLARHRVSSGRPVDHGKFIFVLAQTLASAPAGKYRIRNNFVTWHGLDRVSLARAAYEAGFGQLGGDDPLFERALTKVSTAVAMGSDAAGRLLDVTAEERDLLGIRTIDATDEDRHERESRRREERKVRDRERKRRARAGTMTPRAEYLAKSLSATKPWLALGISRRTYERRNKSVAGVSATTSGDVASVSAPQVCPPTYIINTSTDRLASASQELLSGRPLSYDNATCPPGTVKGAGGSAAPASSSGSPGAPQSSDLSDEARAEARQQRDRAPDDQPITSTAGETS